MKENEVLCKDRAERKGGFVKGQNQEKGRVCVRIELGEGEVLCKNRTERKGGLCNDRTRRKGGFV